MLRVQLTLEDRTITVVGRTVRVTAIDAFTQEVALRFVQTDPDTQRFLEGQEPLLTEDEIDAGLSALESRGEREAARREKRGAPRYRAAIPAVMESEGQFLTGVLENVSASGALLTNPTGSLEVGARCRIRLIDLADTLRTQTESLSLEAEIVTKELGGFRIRFLGDLDELEQLFERALGRHAIKPS